MADKFEERVPIKKYSSIKEQATEIMQRVVDTWIPGKTFIGTGAPDKPTVINQFCLPDIWEKDK